MKSAAAPIFLLAAAVVALGGVDSCSLEGDILTCSLRTLNPRNDTSETDLTSGTLSGASRVRVRCSDVFFYESFLRTNHFGFLPDLRQLWLDSCKIRRVPALAFSGLSGLRSLVLRSRNSEWPAMAMELERDALTGLDRLRRLNLTQNNLWTLPAGAFCELGFLRSLNLSANYLQDLLDLSFSSRHGQSNCRLPLEDLDLSANGFAAVPSNVFGQLSRLKRLNLAKNNLHVLEDKALGGLQSLQMLNLANNDLVALPPELFASSESLQELYLQNNSLSVLSPGVFAPLKQLLVLNLSRNELDNDWVDGEAFATLHRLVALDLSYNKLSRLDRDVLSELSALQILDLRHNNLRVIEARAFSSQRNLHILKLSHNNLVNVHAKVLSGLSQVSSLSIDNNVISTVHANAFSDCVNLQDLALHGNRLDGVPDALRLLPLLRTLDLGENQIVAVDNQSLPALEHLYALRLAGNGLTTLEASTFDSVPTLQVLNLAHNALSQLDPATFEALKELRMLRLDNNQLADINGLLTAQSELRWLNMSANRLQWFDYAFVPRSVQWLDLHENLLEELSNYYNLQDGFSLQTIDASSNRLRRLTSLSLPSCVEFVFLNNNAISEVEGSPFVDKTRLKRVDLSGNQLSQLSQASIALSDVRGSGGSGGGDSGGNAITSDDRDSSSSATPEFLLARNPFQCNCDMEWLQRINQMSLGHQKYPRVFDLDQVQCSLINRGNSSLPVVQFVERVRPEEFLCQYKAHCFALCKCCEFFACDCRMQCPKGCSCFHDSTWSANIIQCSARGHERIPALIPMDATTIYLDGNSFTGVLESQAFIGRKRVRELFLNSSKIEAVSNQTFNGLTELEVLHLEGNFIRRLEGYEMTNLTSLRELYLQNNHLVHIGELSFVHLVSLRVLHLENNHLASFSAYKLQTLPELTQVFLSGNPWSCQCEFVQKLKPLSSVIADLPKVQCLTSSDTSVALLADNATCSETLAVTLQESRGLLADALPLAAGLSAVVLVVACACLVVFVFRTPVRVWLHSRYGVRVLDGRRRNDDKPYDALMCYAAADEAFVQQVLAPQLEQQRKLFLQRRDLGNSPPEALCGACRLSAQLVLVASRSFLTSEWPRVKFALHEASVKKKKKSLVLLLEELTSLDLAVAPEFNLLLKASTVLRWNEAGFWNKLRFYLPEGSRELEDSPKYNEWQYDSSASTRSTIMGGSPRTLADVSAAVGAPVANSHILNNPLESWEDYSSGYEHTYQTIPGSADIGGVVDVMLPNGRLVPATLVRNHQGKLVPLVQFESVIASTSPSPLAEEQQPLQQHHHHQQQQQQPHSAVTFPKTVVYRPNNNNDHGKGHLV